MNVNGVALIDRELLALETRAHDLLPAFEAIAELFAEGERQQFDSEGAWGSGAWSPLSPAYAVRKHAQYPGTKILERTGDLKRSLTERPFGVELISPFAMVVGTNISYAHFHQDGTSRMPRRPPLAMPPQQRVAITKVLQRWVRTGTLI